MSEEKTYIKQLNKVRKVVRLDKYIASLDVNLSRSKIKELILECKVTVNGNCVKPHYQLKKGDEIKIVYTKPKPFEIKGEDIPINILYEDGDIIVINKTSGMVVHPAAGNLTGTLINALIGNQKELSKPNEKTRPGVIHRLDKETSGILVFAKTEEGHLGLARQIEKRSMHREYIAFVWGDMEFNAGRVDAPIGRDPKNRLRMSVTNIHSRNALTNYFVDKRYKIITKLRLKLHTGRTHQIRVHMQHIRHPVVGDPVYGGRLLQVAGKSLKGNINLFNNIMGIIKRQALHATKLGFIHPTKGYYIEFNAPPPEDMQNLERFLKQTVK
ncbi:MAG TPA: RluA family pseudouridine synthase [Firmicutes bacterium]|nr:RluA family pseudouridine synthase [Bacillota bacterium]